MLKEADLFGERDRVAIAIERIREHCPAEGLYVAFSGGKDSMVILDLVKAAGVKYDAHFNVTTVDPPELLNFIRKHYPEVEWHRPKMSMFQLIVHKRMPPTRRVRYCCSELKERGGHGRIIVTGIRAEESYRRSKRRMFEQCFKIRMTHYLNPIIDWSEDDVWDYIRSRKLPYCSLYDEGYKRIGCVMCPMIGAEGMAENARRWPKFAKLYYRAFEAAVAAHRSRGCSYDGPHDHWNTADDMWEWWMSGGRASEEVPNDLNLLWE